MPKWGLQRHKQLNEILKTIQHMNMEFSKDNKEKLKKTQDVKQKAERTPSPIDYIKWNRDYQVLKTR